MYDDQIGWRFNAIHDRRSEEILQRYEKTWIQKTTKTDPKTQGLYRFTVIGAYFQNIQGGC